MKVGTKADYRNTFDEDDMRHFNIKAGNVRMDGGTVGCKPTKPASKATLTHLLDSDSLDVNIRARLMKLQPGYTPDPIQAILDKLPAAKRRILEAILTSKGQTA